MAAAARKKGYEYIGITDHSQSLKIAGGLTEQHLWEQIREIDQWNERLEGIRVLKSAEVDILADGSLDYPDELLRNWIIRFVPFIPGSGWGKRSRLSGFCARWITATSRFWDTRPEDCF